MPFAKVIILLPTFFTFKLIDIKSGEFISFNFENFTKQVENNGTQ